MLRKALPLFLVLVVMVAMIPTAAFAQKGDGPQVPSADALNTAPKVAVPDTVQKGVDLRNAMTPEQLAAVKGILDKYQPEMKAINEAVAAKGKSADGQSSMDAGLVNRMRAVVNNVSSEMKNVLSADQFATYNSIVSPALSQAPDASALANPGGPSTDGVAQDAGTRGYVSECWYSPYYGSYSYYYTWYGYVYAYYDYYYNGTTYAYYSYLYSYYGYYYVSYGINYAAPLYFELYYSGIYSSSYPYYAYLYFYYGELYSYYGELYGYYDYYYNGNTYGYYAYLYGYYGTTYASYAYSDAYTCYSNQ